jgi:hypothetical protein
MHISHMCMYVRISRILKSTESKGQILSSWLKLVLRYKIHWLKATLGLNEESFCDKGMETVYAVVVLLRALHGATAPLLQILEAGGAHTALSPRTEHWLQRKKSCLAQEFINPSIPKFWSYQRLLADRHSIKSAALCPRCGTNCMLYLILQSELGLQLMSLPRLAFFTLSCFPLSPLLKSAPFLNHFHKWFHKSLF